MFDGLSVWVSNFTDNTVTRLRAGDGFVMGTYPVGPFPYQMAFDGSAVWVRLGC